MTTDLTSILIIEDDPNIVDVIRSNLLVRGYAVSVSRDGNDLDYQLEIARPDLVILDLMLPGDADGFTICRRLRATSAVGIIVLSARGGEHDKVRALNLGADDYMTKPFSIEELLARITATLRRSRPAPTAGEEVLPVVTVGEIEIDLTAQRVTLGGELIHLTPTEFAVLRELALHQGALVSHTTLLRNVWGPGYETATEYTRVYIRRLRSKLERPGASLIITEPRVGYRLVSN